MTSLFDDLYGQSAGTTLMQYQGDAATVDYVAGRKVLQTGITAMLGHIEVVEVEQADGTIQKESRRPIVIMRDEESPWVGFDNPQVHGAFIIDCEEWSIEDREQLAIEGKSETFVSCNLVRKRATNKAYPNLRKYS